MRLLSNLPFSTSPFSFPFSSYWSPSFSSPCPYSFVTCTSLYDSHPLPLSLPSSFSYTSSSRITSCSYSFSFFWYPYCSSSSSISILWPRGWLTRAGPDSQLQEGVKGVGSIRPIRSRFAEEGIQIRSLHDSPPNPSVRLPLSLKAELDYLLFIGLEKSGSSIFVAAIFGDYFNLDRFGYGIKSIGLL